MHIPYCLSLLLQRICDKIYSIQKVHENYGRVFREWGAIDADMASGLSRASQYMDVSVPARDLNALCCYDQLIQITSKLFLRTAACDALNVHVRGVYSELLVSDVMVLGMPRPLTFSLKTKNSSLNTWKNITASPIRSGRSVLQQEIVL